jgi:citrate lyase subunit beta-like protein
LYCESARSLIDLRSILSIASDLFSLQGVVFGSDDFSADVGINGRHTCDAWELMYARQKLVTTCRLFENAQPIDMVYIDFKDLDGLQKQAEQGAAFIHNKCLLFRLHFHRRNRMLLGQKT